MNLVKYGYDPRYILSKNLSMDPIWNSLLY